MKKIKAILIFTLCFAFVVITTPTAPSFGINPCGHYEADDTRL